MGSVTRPIRMSLAAVWTAGGVYSCSSAAAFGAGPVSGCSEAADVCSALVGAPAGDCPTLTGLPVAGTLCRPTAADSPAASGSVFRESSTGACPERICPCAWGAGTAAAGVTASMGSVTRPMRMSLAAVRTAGGVISCSAFAFGAGPVSGCSDTADACSALTGAPAGDRPTLTDLPAAGMLCRSTAAGSCSVLRESSTGACPKSASPCVSGVTEAVEGAMASVDRTSRPMRMSLAVE